MELTIKKQTEETINVFPPLFFKKEHKYLGLLNEEQVITFSNKNKYATYSNAEAWLFKTELSDCLTNWSEISEADFIEAHEQFLASQSLKPVLSERPEVILLTNDPDDIRGMF